MAAMHPGPGSVRVERGKPTDDEIAALTAVLASIRAVNSAVEQRRDTPWSVWSEPAVRHAVTPGPAAWRTSLLPR